MGNSLQGLIPDVEYLKLSQKAKETSVVKLAFIRDEIQNAHFS
jgi:hypothetical protein